MRCIVSIMVVLSTVCVGASCDPPQANQPSSDAAFADGLFDPTAPIEIELELDDVALATLAESPREYVPAKLRVAVGDRVDELERIGVALKGNEAGSFRTLDEKAAFKLRFDEFEDAQRLFGLKGVKLNNMVEDASSMHEAVGYGLFALAGVPAPRSGYAVVNVNGVAYGLYAVVERLDDVWAKRFHGDTLHIYEGSLVDVVPEAIEALEVDEGDEDDRSDVEALAQVSVAPDDAFFDELSARTDLTLVAKMWVVSQFIAHWDGYAGAANNYYLHSTEDGRFTMIPSGLDQALETMDYDLDEGQSPFSSQGILFSRCRADAGCAAVLQRARDDLSEDLAGSDLLAQFDAISEAIAPALEEETRRPFSQAEVSEAQARARSFLDSRPDALP